MSVDANVATIFSISRNCGLPDLRTSSKNRQKDRGGRKTLLAIVSLVFGMEIAYKFSTRTVIFLLNPCHVITAIQVDNHLSRFIIALIPLFKLCMYLFSHDCYNFWISDIFTGGGSVKICDSFISSASQLPERCNPGSHFSSHKHAFCKLTIVKS